MAWNPQSPQSLGPQYPPLQIPFATTPSPGPITLPPQHPQYGTTPMPTQVPPPAPTGAQARFGDIYANPTYQCKAAPKQEQEFPFTYRDAFEEGVNFIRFVAHPILLPAGFSFSTWHSIPQSVGDPISCQCPESYDSQEPCFTCCLLKYLDDADNNKNDSILDPAHLGDRAFKVLLENSTAYCRAIMLPFIAKCRAAMTPGKTNPSKSYRKLYPDPNSLVSGILSLKPDKPHPEWGSYVDKPFHRKLQLLTLSDQDLHTIYYEMARHNPEEAQRFFAEASPIFRNPNLFDPQHGSWVAYNRGKKGVPLQMVCQPPTPLDPTIIAKYLSEKTYPDIKKFGSGGERGNSKRLSWWEQKSCWENSWVGQLIIKQLGYSLDLDPNDWIEQNGPPVSQPPASIGQPQQYQPTQYIQPNDVPF